MQLQTRSCVEVLVLFRVFKAVKQGRYYEYYTRTAAPVSTSLPLTPPARGRPPPVLTSVEVFEP